MGARRVNDQVSSGLCSLHGWLEVKTRFSQLTGPVGVEDRGPAHTEKGLSISLGI